MEVCSRDGSTEAENQLGYAYKHGKNSEGLEVEQDYKQAFKWYQRAVDQNHACATQNLAGCHCYGEGVQKDIEKAFELFKKAALMGDASAQNTISIFYRHKLELSENDYLVDIDYYKAAYWNRKASSQGYYLNQSILNVIGLSQDQIDELKKEGNSFDSAKTWYGIAKEYKTRDGVEKDEKKAFEMYKLAARLGSIPAQAALGRCCEWGIGTDVDTQQAIHWYEKATKERHNEAAKSLLNLIQSESTNNGLKIQSPFVSLAECYETGNGVSRNEDAALLMREHAASNGDANALKEVVSAYISGKGNEYRVQKVASVIANSTNLSSRACLQFSALFRESSIDELDGIRIIRNAASAVRTEILGIGIFLE